MKVLFISDFLLLGHSGGAHLSLAHLNTLRSIYGYENVIPFVLTYANYIKHNEYECHSSYSNRIGQLINVLQGNAHVLNNKIIKRIIQIIDNEKIDIVFCDNGYFGKLCKKIKKQFPDILLASFNHGILRNKTNQQISERKRKIVYWPQIYGLLRGEKQTAKYADVNIVINKRDAYEFNKAYNREPELIFPAYIEEMDNIDYSITYTNKAKILFVGGNFFPNIFGIKWFVKNVLSELSCEAELTIVGRGLEFLRNESEFINNNRVKVIGGVEDLSEWYNQSNIVIGPIFHGDGMKTKTAEALQFGKIYIGTKEAICGYDDLKPYECNNKDEYVDLINRLANDGIPSFKPEIRDVFDKYYSVKSAINILSTLNDYLQ